jgi:uncharacterized protein YecE (DUF72 family)
MSRWFLGTIGYSYKDWVGGFYPPGSTQREYLPYYSKVFTSVELDTTFHSIPRTTAVQSWYESTPTEFKFSLKTPHVITHELCLKGAQGLMSEFLDSVYPLQEKLGPVLIQLPPSFTQENLVILREFLGALPASYRYAVEFRHSSWFNDRTAQLLSEYQVCWVSIDFPRIPKKIIPTTDFLYIRWIGVNNLYHYHSYERVDRSEQLLWWLKAIRVFETDIPITYGFFNNDYAGFAAGTCKRFMFLAGLMDEEQNPPYQERLF